MKNKTESDLEKMNKDRGKAEEEYLDSQERKLEWMRIQREGIGGVEDLVLYLVETIEAVEHSEDLGRLGNNPIVYSEAIGIKREMKKLLRLVIMDGSAQEVIDGTEEKHREENDGDEGYV